MSDNKPSSVKLKTGRVGNNFAQYAGEIISVPADEARRMVKAGQAEFAGRDEVPAKVEAR